ncbi:hypothetical protein AAKU55_004541 [Oxalobacteraceae bacterium GrIS 1.11]
MDKHCAGLLNITTLSFALTLTACGGGGGGTTTAPPDTPVTAARTVSGTAAKGILKGATIKVFAVGVDGTAGATAIATTTTKADGTFAIQVPVDVLTFIIEVSGGPGATSADEASGLDVPIAATFKLRDVVKLAADALTTIEGSVSPLTEMIVQAAEKASGGLSADNISSAKTGFAKVFGFDPEQVRPINANLAPPADATDAQKVQSLLLAGFSQMAKDGKFGCAGTDGDKLVCIVGKISGMGTISNGNLTLQDDVRTEIRDAFTAVTANTTINKTGKTSVDGIASFTESKVPLTPGAPTGIQAAKKLFASLRTNLTALSNPGNTGALDIRADAMRADFDKAIAPLDPDLLKWVQLTGKGIDYLRDYQAGNTSTAMLQIYLGATKIGGCTIYSDTAGSIPATAPGNAASVGCSVIRKMVPGSFSGNGLHNTFQQVTAAFTIVPVASSATSYTYIGRARLETWVDNVRNEAADVTVGTYGTTPNRASGTIDYVKSGDALSSITVAGTMPARTDDYGVAITDRETWALSATRTAESGNLFKYALSGAITSIKAGLEVGKISINPDSFVRTEEPSTGGNVKEISLSLAAESGGSKVSGSLSMSQAMSDKSGRDYEPTKLSFTGSLSTNSAQFFSGTLTFQQTDFDKFDSSLPNSASNFLKKNASLVGTLSIPDRPPLKLSISAANLGFMQTSLSGQYDDGSNVINVSMSDTGIAPKTTLLSSAEGVSLTLNGTADSVNVLKDNAKVGVLNTKSGRIDYADGSFESLK